jgi:hypothetical protein
MNNTRALPALRAGRSEVTILPAKLSIKTAGLKFVPEID